MSVTHVLFLDETGNHAERFSPQCPADPQSVFLLCGCLLAVRRLESLATSMAALKRRYFGADEVVLTSRQIRQQAGPFAVLVDRRMRQAFLADLTAMIEAAPATVFAAAVDRSRRPTTTPYSLTLAFVLERVAYCRPSGRVGVVAESRGRREDAALYAEYGRLLEEGSEYLSADRLRERLVAPLEIQPKLANIPGLQLADLLAYPLAQRLRYAESRNPAFEVVWRKLHRSRRGVWGAGFKVVPPVDPCAYGL